MATQPKTIDAYLASLSDDKKAALEKMRKAIQAIAPEAQECISYGVAAFRLHGKPLVAVGASANHCAFYPMDGTTVEAHREDLSGFEIRKGTIHFQPDKPLPAELLRKLVKARIAIIEGKGNKKPQRPSAPLAGPGKR
ncbi:MAG: iron chaperone [Verrucomicrobiia bacterium]